MAVGQSLYCMLVTTPTTIGRRHYAGLNAMTATAKDKGQISLPAKLCPPQRRAQLLPAPTPALLPTLAAPLQHPVTVAKSAKSAIGKPTKLTAPPLRRAIAISSALPL